MKQIVLILLTAILTVSCDKDNDDRFDEDLQGKWVLTDVSCFCGFGDNPDFSGHTLTFDAPDITVENSGEFKFLTNATGEYSVSGNVITFHNGQQYTYKIEPNILELTFVDNPNIADDELFLEYSRE